MSATELVRVTAAARPSGDLADSVVATKTALRLLARRHQQLSADIADLDALLQPLVAATAPRTLAMFGAGVDVVGQLLVTAGENPQRLASEAAFARLCRAAPQPANSRKTTGRHRLNRGGDRAANSALHRIVLCRMRWDPAARDCVRRRTTEGLSKPEIMRCLTRYVARQVYRQIRADLDPGIVLPTAT